MFSEEMTALINKIGNSMWPYVQHQQQYYNHGGYEMSDLKRIFDPDLIDKYVADGLITCREHKDHPGLRILNYTAQVQYRKEWDIVTETCRGLVIDGNNKIIARPFPKFHNLEEYDNLDFLKDLRCTSVQDKIDGSLGLLVSYDNDVFLATRGSFHSTQAEKGTQILHQKYPEFVEKILNSPNHHQGTKSTTYLFEIIYPQNRIVIDYGNREDIVLLCGLSIYNAWTKKAEDLTMWTGNTAAEFLDAPLKTSDVEQWLNIKDLRPDDGNSEGYVLTFDQQNAKPDLRIKIKYDEYKRLHRLLTGINEKRIWEALCANTPILDMLGDVPDEFYKWVQEVQEDLLLRFSVMDEAQYKIFDQTKQMLGINANRKEYAEEFMRRSSHPDILFKMLDGKDYAPNIFRHIMPEIASAKSYYKESEEEV